MSGGSLNYLYQRVEEAADKKSFVHDAGFKQNTPLRKAFAKHLLKVAKALHDIEWVDSDDMSPGDENQAIADCMDRKELVGGFNPVQKVVDQLREERNHD